MPKYINAKQFKNYKKIYDALIKIYCKDKNNKNLKYYKEDADLFDRMENSIMDFEWSFWDHDKNGNILHMPNGDIKMKKFNKDGNMYYVGEKIKKIDLLDMTE